MAISFASAPATARIDAMQEIPQDSLKVPELAKEYIISTYVPSKTVKGKGLAVSFVFTQKARYKDGAPVAVVVPPGTGANGMTHNAHISQIGMIEMRMAFPGGGTRDFYSDGEFDNRGFKSAEALRDVILFAAGKSRDYQNRTLQDLIWAKAQIKVDHSNIGLVGWDQGGNTALVCLGKHSDDLSGVVKWLAFYESPVGALFTPPNLGSVQDLVSNKHYRQGSAATGNLIIDWRKLAWSPSQFRSPNRLTGQRRGMPGLKGVLFFDDNLNKNWEESREFAFTPALDVTISKQYFPPQITAACERLEVFGEEWPDNVATLAETEEFFTERDGSLYIDALPGQYPRLAVGMFASLVDHGQQQEDHPHIAFLYNKLLQAKVKWLRLNPDPVYMANVSAMNPATFINNKPNAPIDSADLISHLEPKGIFPDYVFMQGLISELADRVKTGNGVYPLVTPLCPFEMPAQPAIMPAKPKQ